MNFSGKVWSDHGMTWLHFWSIPRKSAMPRCATRGRGLLCFRTTKQLVLNFSHLCFISKMLLSYSVFYLVCFSYLYLYQQNANAGCNSCASLAWLVSCFIAAACCLAVIILSFKFITSFIYATADEAIAYMFYRCFFAFFLGPSKKWENRSRERLNGFSWNYYQTIAGKM